VSFDLKWLVSDVTKLDPKLIAPQLGGGIVSTLVEFLGDQVFGVPFYSADVLGAYRDYRKNKGLATGATADQATLSKAIEIGTISEADSKRLLGLSTIQAKDLLISGYGNTAVVPVPPSISNLKAGDDIPVFCDLLKSGANATPLIRSGVARLVLAKLAQLDANYPAQLATTSTSTDTIASIKAGKSKFQAKFTCFKAGVITQNLECLFVTDAGAGKQGVCGPDDDSGRSIEDGAKADYANLVGSLVAFGGTSAEKGVRSIIGGLIRGVAIASLQNEVIAEVVASLASSLSRKFVESATYLGLRSFIVDDTTIAPDDKRKALQLPATLHGLFSG
jgi:hypothetical protein